MSRRLPHASLWLRVAAGLAVALPSVGCAPARMVNALVPKEGYRVERDLAYGELRRQRFDVYVPDDLAAPAPVVVFLYGGRWDSGSKDDYLFVGQALASRGFVTVIPDYRLYPEVRFPDFVEDGAAALARVEERIGEFGGDPARIHVMGHSAGAHIAALLALDDGYLGAEGLSPDLLAGWIGLAGPYDFLPIEDRTLQKIFAAPDMSVTQPITFADGDGPPAFLLHGRADRTVAPRNSEALAERINGAGGTATLRLYPDVGHLAIVGALAAPFRWLASTLDDVAAFVAGGAGPES